MPPIKSETPTQLDPVSTILQSIIRLRQGQKLDAPEIETIIHAYTAGTIPDYQMSAWLATICAVGIGFDETVALTQAYISSGQEFHAPAAMHPLVDKHSTGGIGDKTSLIIAPIVAACGVNVCKMTGRGLGITGGTVDKLESIPGMRMDLNCTEIIRVLEQTALVVTGQSNELAPGDRATYALRDVTATVDNLNLIAASIMSKKIALHPDYLVLDVKYGSGALMSDTIKAIELAELLKAIATAFTLPCNIIISSMSDVLGHNVGNALEVKEAYAVVQGKYDQSDPQYIALCLQIAQLLVQAAWPNKSKTEITTEIQSVISSGRAAQKFREWIAAQGGDASVLADPHWAEAPYSTTIYAQSSGWVKNTDALAWGTICLKLGAGRQQKGDSIRSEVGVRLNINRGDYVEKGAVLAIVDSATPLDNATITSCQQAISISAEKVPATPLIHAII